MVHIMEAVNAGDKPWWQQPPFWPVTREFSNETYAHCEQVTANRIDFEERDFDGITPGMLVAAVNDGLDVQLESDSGGSYNLLQYAVFLKRDDLVATLVQLGATLDGGKRPFFGLAHFFMRIRESKDHDIARVLRALGRQALHPKMTAGLYELLKLGYTESAFVLFRRGADPLTGVMGFDSYGFFHSPAQRSRRREIGFKRLLERIDKEKRNMKPKIHDPRFTCTARHLRLLENGERCVKQAMHEREAVITAGVALLRSGLPRPISMKIVKLAFLF
jgi:hypothetical protein